MRISGNKDHPWFTMASAFANVFLDGAQLSYCTHASEKQGKAWCYALDESGNFIRDGENLLIKEMEGTVVIEIPERYHDLLTPENIE